MATEETRRGAAERPANIPEAQWRHLWGLVGVLIAVLFWIRLPRPAHVFEPDWLSKGLPLGLFLGAYFGMASWRGRRERLARGVKVFALTFLVILAFHAVRGLFTG